MWVERSGARFASEFAVPLVLARRPSAAPEDRRDITAAIGHSVNPVEIRAADLSPAMPLRPPGSDWLFLKIYTGTNLHDDLVSGPLFEFCEYVVQEKLAHRYFFLRYTDPDPHLRIRFSGDPNVLTEGLFPVVCDWASQLLKNGYSSRFSFDTYDREVERYGGDAGIQIAEAIFCEDSTAVLRYKTILRAHPISIDIDDLAVVTLTNLLAGLGLDETDRLSWLRDYVTWGAEIGPEYRKKQATLRPLVGNLLRGHSDPRIDPLNEALVSARVALRPLGEDLRAAGRQGLLKRPLAKLYATFAHLHCNRLIGMDARKEQVALGLLLRTEASLAKAPVSLP